MRSEIPALFDNLWMDHLQRYDHKYWNDNNVIQVTDDRDKIRDDIKREECVPNGKPQKEFCYPGCSPVSHHILIHHDFFSQALSDRSQFVQHIYAFDDSKG